METAYSICKNPFYIVPIAMILCLIYLYIQKWNTKKCKNKCIDTPLMMRTSIFIGLLVFIIVWFNKPFDTISLEDSLNVNPANF